MKKNRFLCALLTAALLLSAAGCSSSSMTEAVDAPANAKNAAITEDADVAYGIKSDDYSEDAAEGFAADKKMLDAAAAFDSVDGGAVLADGAGAPATIDIAEPEKTRPEAGQLTAGQWNDNDNWGFFSNLVNSGTISFPQYGIDPTHRTAVTVKDKDGKPVVNAHADLLDKDGKVLWSGVTNKNGVVYLFDQSDVPAVSVDIESDGKKQNYKIESGKSNNQTETTADNINMEVVFDGKGSLRKKTDIMFILDTTSSMSDEMLFLQSEFTDIVKSVGAKDTRFAVNFYRDEGDEYVTKCNSFTNDVDDLQTKLNNESAEGGGDIPEAVAEILTESIFESDWDEDAVKIAFLIFDAPPHDDDKSIGAVLAAAQEASNKGIRLVPVVASNSDRETELFGRAVAITTGSDYVFLTDDSGIGDSHTEPIIGSYEVRKLNQIIIDIINDYKQ